MESGSRWAKYFELLPGSPSSRAVIHSSRQGVGTPFKEASPTHTVVRAVVARGKTEKNSFSVSYHSKTPEIWYNAPFAGKDLSRYSIGKVQSDNQNCNDYRGLTWFTCKRHTHLLLTKVYGHRLGNRCSSSSSVRLHDDSHKIRESMRFKLFYGKFQR